MCCWRSASSNHGFAEQLSRIYKSDIICIASSSKCHQFILDTKELRESVQSHIFLQKPCLFGLSQGCVNCSFLMTALASPGLCTCLLPSSGLLLKTTARCLSPRAKLVSKRETSRTYGIKLHAFLVYHCHFLHRSCCISGMYPTVMCSVACRSSWSLASNYQTSTHCCCCYMHPSLCYSRGTELTYSRHAVELLQVKLSIAGQTASGGRVTFPKPSTTECPFISLVSH